MKTMLRLKNQKLVTDLHELKLYINEIKEFERGSKQAYQWIKENYKDDKLAQDILECSNKEAMLYCINEKLQDLVEKKLKFLEEVEKSEQKEVAQVPGYQITKYIVPQSRDKIIEKIKEVHEIGRRGN